MDSNDTGWRRHLSETEENRWFDRLFDPEQEAIRRAIDAPDLGDLRAGDLPVTVARADVLPRLLTWFSPAERDPGYGWQHHPERSGAVGESSFAVEWTFSGSYDPSRLDAQDRSVDNAGAFNGVQPLGQSVELHGVTLLSVEDGALRLRRYIDWVGLYAQLGLSVNWRVRQGAGSRDTAG